LRVKPPGVRPAADQQSSGGCAEGDETRVTERRAWRAGVGSLVFFLLVPGTVAGWVPYWLTGWHTSTAFRGQHVSRLVGAIVIVAGLLSLVDSFVRFALLGRGTPAPVAHPTTLVVSGPYRHVRNPMYVAVLLVLIGQSFLLGSVAVLGYCLLVGALFHAFVVFYEEPTLVARFGPSYELYRKHVKRWWPRIRPWRG
jgi:protein-S-isoprenylcysteine O-methyltransferase Ste14